MPRRKKKKGILERFLERAAEYQKKHAITIVVVVLLFTAFMLFGVARIEMETDFSKEQPQDIPIVKTNQKITDSFGGQDVIIVLLMIDDDIDSENAVNDVRDPRVQDYLMELGDALRLENSIEGISSSGEYLHGAGDLAQVRQVLESRPGLLSFFSKDYRKTIMMVSADAGGGERKVNALSNLINEKIDSISSPPGVEVMITGTPNMRITLLNILKSDAIYTMSLASIIILFLLFIIEKSFRRGILIFVPLALGLIWTMGSMGWLGLKISVATVGLGAMILGLGVEYGVFMLTRFKEERHKGKDQKNSLETAVPSVGSAILGSGMTTITGFLALTLSITPMLQHLGQSLAMGIFFCLVAAVFVMPVIIILEERINRRISSRIHKEVSATLKDQEGRPV
ncbi:MAG: MMPL family transporter [Candidatus Woesearchaeota archaeon]